MENQDREILLIEYEMAQNSAEHHDNLVWSVSTLTWGISSVLLGFTLSNLSEHKHIFIMVLFSCIGILLILCAWLFTIQFRSIKNQKYKRCLEIEKILRLSQHTNVKHKAGSQAKLYSLIMVLFIITWIVVFVNLVKPYF